jgi:hypothetical protein
MEIQNSTAGERIGYFADICFGSRKNLADALKVKPQNLNQHISIRRSPSLDNLEKYWKIGLSIDWLIHGKDSFFSNNDEGIKLRYKIRTKALFQIAYTYLNNLKNPNFNDFINNILNFSFLLNQDYLSFAAIINELKTINQEQINKINKEYFLRHTIDETAFRAIFGDSIVDWNYNIIEQLIIPWPINPKFIPKNIPAPDFLSVIYNKIDNNYIIELFNDKIDIKIEKVLTKKYSIHSYTNNRMPMVLHRDIYEYEKALEFIKSYNEARDESSKKILESIYFRNLEQTEYFSLEDILKSIFPEFVYPDNNPYKPPFFLFPKNDPLNLSELTPLKFFPIPDLPNWDLFNKK